MIVALRTRTNQHRHRNAAIRSGLVPQQRVVFTYLALFLSAAHISVGATEPAAPARGGHGGNVGVFQSLASLSSPLKRRGVFGSVSLHSLHPPLSAMVGLAAVPHEKTTCKGSSRYLSHTPEFAMLQPS